ncbi:hypothetical protein RhiirA1_467082 [Rhizophagus irregularis]|uniref:Uncharacterized protein n=1 Tax=Rhizophagus irregularis TaxID=588596 RepID=A0A2I1FCH8_9GLOM|nr:hypothetical protein RhiirA1_467082 [Rhizophagus irregularis]PKY32092.1 hypothetical protein RhiirB3_450030 [Rhizophagus irregularis]
MPTSCHLRNRSPKLQKEVHSKRLGIGYTVTIRKYNRTLQQHNQRIDYVVNRPFSTDPNQIANHRPHYKEYHSLRFDAVHSPQQIPRWNRIIQAVYNFADKVNSEVPFLTENSEKACSSSQA